MFAVPALLEGASIVPTHLAPLSCVNFSLPLGGLQYQPIPTLDLKNLGSEVEQKTQRILESYDIEVSQGCQQTLQLNLDYDRPLRSNGFTVFSIELQLQENATLERLSQNGKNSPIVRVTSWRISTLLWTRETPTMASLIEEIEEMIEEFGQKVRQARHAKGGQCQDLYHSPEGPKELGASGHHQR
jgi:metal-sulfur cluster biosynthetic enzyme